MIVHNIPKRPDASPEKKMVAATDAVLDLVTAKDCTMRDAAFDIAVERVAYAAHLRGYV